MKASLYNRSDIRTSGFGLIGILIVVAVIGVSVYFTLQSFKQETSLIVPGTATGTTPIQAAENARTIEETQSINAAKLIQSAKNAAHQ